MVVELSETPVSIFTRPDPAAGERGELGLRELLPGRRKRRSPRLPQGLENLDLTHAAEEFSAVGVNHSFMSSPSAPASLAA
jgi:hypothetical protein